MVMANQMALAPSNPPGGAVPVVETNLDSDGVDINAPLVAIIRTSYCVAVENLHILLPNCQ